MTEDRGGMNGTLRWATLAIGIAAVLGLIGGFASFRRYVETSPRFCQTCHEVAPEIAIWTESQHRDIVCQKCHHQSLDDGLRILKVYLSGATTQGEHAPIDVSSCGQCHASHDARWPGISESIGHQVHAEKVRLECTTCHGAQMHFQRPARATCLSCHPNRTTGSAHEEAHCLACHNFVAESDALRPTRPDCLRCHANQEYQVVVSPEAPMRFACASCHMPHAGGGMVDCAECHPRGQLAGLHQINGHAGCRSCHEPHEWESSKEQCKTCHASLKAHDQGRKCSACHRFEAGLGTGP